MKKNILLFTSMSALALQTLSARENNKPNVIIIYADDIGFGDLQCYGAKNVATPNVNRFADEGCRFTNAYAVAATSTPSRYSLLTGQYAWRKPGTDIAAGNAGMIIRPEQFTMADLFKGCGYTTGAVGKWHLGIGDKTAEQDWNAPLPVGLGDIGFDYSYIMAATGDRVPCVFLENGQVANRDPSAPIEVDYEKPFDGVPTAVSNPELCYNQESDFGHKNAVINGIGRIGWMKGGGKALWKDENIADSIAEHAVRFIRQNKDRPMFLLLATNDIHVPRFPHERFRGKTNMGVRGDAIVEFDWIVGRVRQTLDELQLADNTIVIISSDNGPVVNDGYKDNARELLNGHSPAGPLRGNKYSAFEGGTRIPFIVWWKKGIKGGQTSDALVSQVDLMGSFRQLLNGRMPQGAGPDSREHWDVMTGENREGREYVIGMSLTHTLSIRTKDWRYIEPSNDPVRFMPHEQIETGNLPTPQLYRVSKDIHEDKNVADANPEMLRHLQGLLKTEKSKGYIRK